MATSFVHATAAATSSTTELALTIPGAAEGVTKDMICLAHLYLGNVSSASAAGELPEGWRHAYASPYASEIAAGAYIHAVFAWKILTENDLNQGITFTRDHTTGDSFRGFLSAWSNPLGFDPDDPFNVQKSRDTGFSGQSGTNLGVIDIEDPGDIAVTWCVADTASSGFWTQPSGWTRARGSFGGTGGGMDSHYRVESGGDSQTNAAYFYVSNNKWIHWAFTFQSIPNAPGTTLAKLQSGGGVYAYVLAIEGYPKLLTNWPDTDAVTRAWSGTDWSEALSGLKVLTEFEQEIEPFNPVIDYGSAQFRFDDGETDEFAEAVFSSLKNTGKSGNLSATAEPSDTTLTLQNTDDLTSSGTAYIGPENISYTGKTSTTLTGVTRGRFAPFGNSSGDGMARRHEVVTTSGVSTFLPPVTDYKRVWIGSRVGLWLHKVEDDGGGLKLNHKDDARLMFAGQIAQYTDDARGSTFLTCTDIRNRIADTVLMGDQFSVELVEGLYLNASDYFNMVGKFDGGSNQITVDFAEQRYTAHDVMELINLEIEAYGGSPAFEWLARIDGDGRTFFRAGISGTGRVELDVHATARVAQLLGLDPTIAVNAFPGFDERDIYWRWRGEESRVTTNPYSTLYSAAPYGKYAPSDHYAGLQTFEGPSGTWINQAEDIPSPFKEAFGTSGGDWGFLSFGEDYFVLAERTSDTEFTLHFHRGIELFFRQSLPTSDPDLPPMVRYPEEAPTLKQVVWLQGDYDQVITKLVASTGDAGYNHATYDAYPAQLGAAVPWDLLGDGFLESVRDIGNRLNPTTTLLLQEPTKLSEILVAELALRNAHMVFSEGITFRRVGGGVPITSATHTLTDANVVGPILDGEGERPTSDVTREYIVNVLRLRHSYNAQGDFTRVQEIVNPTSVREYGERPVTIEARNMMIWGPYQRGTMPEAVERLGADVLAVYDEPLQKVELSVSGDKIVSMVPGDTVALSSSWVRYHGDGQRGVTNVLGYLSRVSYDLGSLDGSVSIILTGDEGARASQFSPAAQIDETENTGDYSAGYDATAGRIKVKADAFSLGSEDDDVTYFEVGNEVRIIEKSPATPASPQTWSVTIDAVNTATHEIDLDAALTGFDSNKQYYVTSQPYSTATTEQKVDTYLADDADDFIEGAERSRTFRNVPVQAVLMPFGADPDVYFENVPTDGSWGDEGEPLHPAMYQALADNVNNLISHHTAIDLASTGLLTFTSGHVGSGLSTYYLACLPVYLPFSHDGRPRTITIGPRFRVSSGSGTARIRVTISQEPPRSQFADSLVQVAFRDTEPVKQLTFDTTSTSYVNATAQSTDLILNDGAACWLTIEQAAELGTSIIYAGLHTLHVGKVT